MMQKRRLPGTNEFQMPFIGYRKEKIANGIMKNVRHAILVPLIYNNFTTALWKFL
jgi:hypothetical protein